MPRLFALDHNIEIGAFFGGVGPDSADAELRRIAPDHPVFRVTKD